MRMNVNQTEQRKKTANRIRRSSAALSQRNGEPRAGAIKRNPRLTGRRNANRTRQKTDEETMLVVRIAAVVVIMSVVMNHAATVAHLNQVAGDDKKAPLTKPMIRVNQQKVMPIQLTNARIRKPLKAPAQAAAAANRRKSQRNQKVNLTAIVVRADPKIVTVVWMNARVVVIQANIRRKPKRANMRVPAHAPDLAKGVSGRAK